MRSSFPHAQAWFLLAWFCLAGGGAFAQTGNLRPRVLCDNLRDVQAADRVDAPERLAAVIQWTQPDIGASQDVDSSVRRSRPSHQARHLVLTVFEFNSRMGQ